MAHISVAARATPDVRSESTPRSVGAFDKRPATSASPQLDRLPQRTAPASATGLVSRAFNGVPWALNGVYELGQRVREAITAGPAGARPSWQAFARSNIKELDTASLHKASVYAALADYPYQVDTKGIREATNDVEGDQHGTWEPDHDLASEIAAGCGLICKDGCISNGNGGLMAYVFANPVTKEVTIVFGGTTSTYAGGGAYNPWRLLSGARHHANQWMTNVQAVCGPGVPQSYNDAVALVKHANTKIKDRKLTTCGHSLGGSLAGFAAAMNSTDERKINAICFCTPPLGAPLVSALADKYSDVGRLDGYAKENVRHFNVEGDPVPELGHWLPYTDQIGTAYPISATHVSGPSIVRTAAYYLPPPLKGVFLHVDFFGQVRQAVKTELEGRGQSRRT